MISAADPWCARTLYRLSPEEHVLLLVMHHIVSDGWSMAIFFKELERVYSGHHAGEACPAG